MFRGYWREHLCIAEYSNSLHRRGGLSTRFVLLENRSSLRGHEQHVSCLQSWSLLPTTHQKRQARDCLLPERLSHCMPWNSRIAHRLAIDHHLPRQQRFRPKLHPSSIPSARRLRAQWGVALFACWHSVLLILLPLLSRWRNARRRTRALLPVPIREVQCGFK